MEAIQTEKNFRKGTLDEIVSRYEIVLFDTSALMSPFYKDVLNPSAQVRSDNEKYICRATEFLQDYAKTGKISVIPAVFEEYSSVIDSRYHIKQKIKKGKSNLTREVLGLIRTRAEKNKQKNKLQNFMESSGSIIQFDEDETKLYKSLADKFNVLTGSYGVSNTHFSFLISGIVLSRTRGSTALVSNSFKIFNFFRHLRGFYGISNDKINFFIRNDVNQFEALYKRPSRFYLGEKTS